jgi:hypothetical protein
LQSATLTITYNAKLLQLNRSEVKLAPALAASGWTLVDSVEQAAGVVYAQLNGPSLTSESPELLDLTFQVPSNDPAGTSALTVAGTLNDGLLVMTPVDGSITVPAASTPAATSLWYHSTAKKTASVDHVLASTASPVSKVASNFDTLASAVWANQNKKSGPAEASDAALLSMYGER